jgi:hypothetical protein
VVVGIAGVMMAVALLSPALAVRLATTSYVKQKVNQAFNRTFNQFLQTPIAYFRTDPIAVGPGAAQIASIGCPAGGVAIGGGAAGAAISEDWDLEQSYPSNGATTGAGTTGWTVAMENASAGPLNFRAYVVCGGATSTFTNYAVGGTPVKTAAKWDPAGAEVQTKVVNRG